jgi:hypothetical protein
MKGYIKPAAASSLLLHDLTLQPILGAHRLYA